MLGFLASALISYSPETKRILNQTKNLLLAPSSFFVIASLESTKPSVMATTHFTSALLPPTPSHSPPARCSPRCSALTAQLLSGVRVRLWAVTRTTEASWWSWGLSEWEMSHSRDSSEVHTPKKRNWVENGEEWERWAETTSCRAWHTCKDIWIFFLRAIGTCGSVLAKGRTCLNMLFSSPLCLSWAHFAGHGLRFVLVIGDPQSQLYH